MKMLAFILLFVILGVGVHGQTIKSLGYNTTNGEIVYNGTNSLMLTNGSFRIGQIGSDITEIGQTGMSADTYGYEMNWEENYFQEASTFEIRVDELRLNSSVTFGGTNAVANASTTRTNLGLGATWLTNTNSPLFWVTPPAATNSTGVAGQIAYTNNYLYICISNNTWRRVQIGTW